MHRTPRPDLAGPSPRYLPALRDAVRTLLGLDEDTAVVIRQLLRTVAGRPRLETVVAVLSMDGGTERWTLRGPTDRITDDDLRAVLPRRGPGRDPA
ncbi:hypothetical protein ACIBCP_14895 [Streptomyces sp. NPDC051287]|uniref:hypothetical protein n=1 Tax=Streptomyces sp. NPDC051287 TaxID=3365648 RepID=UPI00379B8748